MCDGEMYEEDGVAYDGDDWCYEDVEWDDVPDPADNPGYTGETDLD